MATPLLEREQWENLVGGMFTGAVLSDSEEDGGLLIKGEIWDILKTKYKTPENLKSQRDMYQKNDQGEIIPQDYKVKER